MQLSLTTKKVPASPIRSLMHLAEIALNRGIYIYRLNIGDPDIETPQVMIEALKNWKINPIGYSDSKGQEELLQSLLEYYKNLDFNSTFPLTLPTMPLFRKTRRIVGRETIKDSDVNRDIPNSIGKIPDWREAGKIISAEGDAWDAFRVIPAAAHIGELVGKLAVN